jgi:hypothetical protein
MATLPPATIETPATAGVGPITVAFWPTSGPMKVGPAPTHAWVEVPPVRLWPSSVVAIPHGPATALLGVDRAAICLAWSLAKVVGTRTVLALAAGAPTASAAVAASAAMRGLRSGIMLLRFSQRSQGCTTRPTMIVV